MTEKTTLIEMTVGDEEFLALIKRLEDRVRMTLEELDDDLDTFAANYLRVLGKMM